MATGAVVLETVVATVGGGVGLGTLVTFCTGGGVLLLAVGGGGGLLIELAVLVLGAAFGLVAGGS